MTELSWLANGRGGTAFSLSVLLLVPVLVLVLVALLRRGAGGAARVPRRPRPRHIVVRLICASLGLAILIALAVGTWRTVRETYANGEAAQWAAKVKVPTRPFPLPPPTASRPNEIPIDRAQVLIDVVLAEVEGDAVRPLHIEEFVVPYVEGQAQTRSCSVEIGGVKGALGFRVMSIRGTTGPNRQEVTLGSMSLDWRTRNSHASSSGGLALGVRTLAGPNFRARNFRPVLAAVPTVTRRDVDTQTIVIATLAAEDDPLKEVPVSDLLASRRAEIASAAARVSEPRASQSYRSGPENVLRMLKHLGPAALFLLAASVLLAQVFTRRVLAYAGLVFLLMLYAAALDRVVLGAHLARLADSHAPVEVRLTAVDAAAQTFFYRGTAVRRLERVGADPTAPPFLRRRAERAAAALAIEP